MRCPPTPNCSVYGTNQGGTIATVNANSAPEAARIGRRITALRRERGWSLNELALRAGVGKATLSGVEAGTRNPTLETLYAIAGQLGLPLAAVLADPRDGIEAVSTVHGTAVTAELLAVFNEPTAVFEYYRVVIKPSLRSEERRVGKEC